MIGHGKSTSVHYHPVKDEVLYVAQGVLSVQVYSKTCRDGTECARYESELHLQHGEAYRIEPGLIHRLSAPEGNIKVLEASTFHDDNDVVRLEVIEQTNC